MYRDGFWQPINSIDDPNANPNDRINNVTNTWEVNEKLTTAFVKFGIDTELGSMPLRGNIGVQAITGRSDLGAASDERARSRRIHGHRADHHRHRGRQVHRRVAQPEPGARIAA